MLANIYHTDSGKDFMQREDASAAIVNFCNFSFSSVNPKVVFTAAILLINHILCFKLDKSLLNELFEKALVTISEKLADKKLVDPEALSGLLLCECRIVYKNKHAVEFIKNKLEPQFRKNHQNLKTRISAQVVKEAVNDLLLMIFDD